MDTQKLINQLEDLVAKSRQLFNTAFVNTDDFYRLLDKIRTSLPEDVRRANRIIVDADQILANAKDQTSTIIVQAKADADKIIADANAEAERLVDASEIKRLATVQAKDIVASAEEAARATKAGADEYAREVLADLEGFASKVLSTIRHGRDKLERKPGSEKNINE